MSMSKLAVVAVALGLALGGLGSAFTNEPRSDDGGDPVALDVRRNEQGEEVAPSDDDDRGDGDRTRGDDRTSGGDNTGDRDAMAGNDGTRGGNNTGDWTGGNDGTGGGDNTAAAPAGGGGGGDGATGGGDT